MAFLRIRISGTPLTPFREWFLSPHRLDFISAIPLKNIRNKFISNIQRTSIVITPIKTAYITRYFLFIYSHFHEKRSCLINRIIDYVTLLFS